MDKSQRYIHLMTDMNPMTSPKIHTLMTDDRSKTTYTDDSMVLTTSPKPHTTDDWNHMHSVHYVQQCTDTVYVLYSTVVMM